MATPYISPLFIFLVVNPNQPLVESRLMPETAINIKSVIEFASTGFVLNLNLICSLLIFLFFFFFSFYGGGGGINHILSLSDCPIQNGDSVRRVFSWQNQHFELPHQNYPGKEVADKGTWLYSYIEMENQKNRTKNPNPYPIWCLVSSSQCTYYSNVACKPVTSVSFFVYELYWFFILLKIILKQ